MLEFGGGKSVVGMASSAASSTRRERRVKTLRTRNVTTRKLTRMKMNTPLRIVGEERTEGGRGEREEEEGDKTLARGPSTYACGA